VRWQQYLSSNAIATCSSSLNPCTCSSRASALTSSGGGRGGSGRGGGGVRCKKSGLSPASTPDPAGEKISAGKSGGGGGGSSPSSSDEANSMPVGTGGGAGVEISSEAALSSLRVTCHAWCVTTITHSQPDQILVAATAS
jgi:hypothetical protein